HYVHKPQVWSQADGYANRNLAWHLRQAGDSDTLFALLDDASWRAAQVRYDVTGTAFVNDLAHAWVVADHIAQHGEREVDRGRALAQAIRCALATTHARSHLQRWVPSLIAQLVITGEWTGRQALAVLQHATDSQYFRALAAHLPDEALGEALELAARLSDFD